MNRRDEAESPRPLHPITDADLTAHALSRLDPTDRERVERALRDDAAVRARYETIATHLARYDALEAPSPPPFAELARRLPTRQRAGGVPVRLAWAGTAAAVVLVLVGLWLRSREPAIPARVGEGVLVTETGAWIAVDEPAEAWLAERVHVVLDARARLRPLSAERVRLEAGRAFFEVVHAPFAVETHYGEVRVHGTAFEVAVEDDALFVAVAEGEVEAAGRILAAGDALAGGEVAPTPHEPGSFFRRPRLRLTLEGPVAEGPGAEGPGAGVLAAAGEPLTLRFTFANPGRVPFALAGPDGVRAPLWLEIVDPAGAVHDIAVPGVDAPEGPLPAGRPVQLAARGERAFTARLGLPSRDRGVYRCRALYRPEGQPSLVSDAVLVEVR